MKTRIIKGKIVEVQLCPEGEHDLETVRLKGERIGYPVIRKVCKKCGWDPEGLGY